MKKLIAVAQAVLLAILLLAGTANAALLTGKTPASYSLPSGWNLVRATDFESGCNATYENCYQGQSTTWQSLIGAW
jgi:hypothetical protein